MHWNSDVTKLFNARSFSEIGVVSLREFFEDLEIRTISGLESLSVEDFDARIIPNARADFQVIIVVDEEKIPISVQIDPIKDGFYADG